MSIFDAIILGLLQGLTEFLPVSSSGHLVLSQHLLHVKEPGITFEIILHVGSLLAVLIYFRSRLISLLQSVYHKEKKKERRLIFLLLLGTLPAVIAALLFKDFFEQAFSNPILTACMLMVTGFILLMTRFIPKGNKSPAITSAIVMGIGQALAILPGISRSGTTISTGMFAKVEPSEAAEFSFLLSIPAILGALVFKIDELSAVSSNLFGPYLVGIIVTFGSSLFAIYAVLKLIKKGKFEYFAYYCFAAGLIALYLFW